MIGYAIIATYLGGLPLWAFWRRRRRIRRLERGIREWRQMLSDQIRCRPVEAADRDTQSLLRATDADVKELCARGFAVIGDMVRQPRDQPALAVMRVLVDDVGTTYAFVIVSLEKPGPPVLDVESYSEDAEWSTMRGTARPSGPALGAFAHRQLVAPAAGLGALLEKHRAFAGLDAPDAPVFIRCTTLAELVTELERAHDRTVQWRAAQPSEALLDADLRGILGASYEAAGSWWRRRLTAPLPKARMRKKA